MQALRFNQIHFPPEKCFQLAPERGMVQKAAPRLKLHEKIDVAPVARIPARDGAEDADVLGSMLGGKL
jgi:hypothetical protein